MRKTLLALTFAGISLLSGCTTRYTLDEQGKLSLYAWTDDGWDFDETNSKGQKIFYDIEPDLLYKPKEFKLKKMSIDNILYFPEDTSVFLKAEERIHEIINRAYFVEDSLRKDYGLKALED